MNEVNMPRLSDSMEEGTIVRWLKLDGEEVRRGEELVEIETDKATVTFEAERDGVLQIVAQANAVIRVGERIAYVASAAELVDQVPASPPSASAGATPAQEPARVPDRGSRIDRSISASPMARRLARQHNVDLREIAGTGPNGRIIGADITAVSAAAGGVTEGPPLTSAAKGDVAIRELTRTQQVIARRMAESRATIPDFTLEVEIDMEAATHTRAEVIAGSAKGAATPSLNDLLIKACALALREFPLVNGAYCDGRFELYSRINIGVAVAAPGALIVPTIFDADRKSVAEIASESRALAAKARNGSLSPPELAGATFTISNLGMHGISSFRAVINPPQAAILAVGAVRSQAVALDGGGVGFRRVMTVTLSCDHRILYGAEAARFLERLGVLLAASTIMR